MPRRYIWAFAPPPPVCSYKCHFCNYPGECYECDVCKHKFGRKEHFDSGEHGFKRKKVVVNCNDYYVKVTQSGRRMIKNKKEEAEKERIKKEKEQKKAEEKEQRQKLRVQKRNEKITKEEQENVEPVYDSE